MSLRSNIGPKIMNAMRAADRNVTKVAAMNASEVLQSVSIPASVVIEMIERTESERQGFLTVITLFIIGFEIKAVRALTLLSKIFDGTNLGSILTVATCQRSSY